jgi:hypothetical protein
MRGASAAARPPAGAIPTPSGSWAGSRRGTAAGRRMRDPGLTQVGRTNREIARQLYLTVNTVETHLRHVYA